MTHAIRGFTLIEFLVAMGILVIITSVVISNFREGERRSSLNLKAQLVVSDLREAQNKAQVAQTLSSGQTPLSYGIQFIRTQQQYKIFAETSSPNYQLNGSDPVLETVNLGDFTISNINGGACTTFNVGFAVPSADVYFNGGQEGHHCGGNNPATIELSDNYGNFIEIKVNWISGQITHTSIY